MPGISFSKLVPSGNPTIILSDPDLESEDGQYDALPGIAARLMHPMHLQAEQVGALFIKGGAIPHLQMMGGEFCVNATRAAAFLLARQGRLELLPQGPGAECGAPKHPVWAGEVTVSGMHGTVRVLVSPDAEALCRAIENQADFAPQHSPVAELPSSDAVPPQAGSQSLYCAACIPCDAQSTSCTSLQPGACLVHLPGISHLLLDTAVHALPDLGSDAWHRTSAQWRNACGLADSPASGVIWYERAPGGYRIWPAVEVRATASEHLETACGSASLALTLFKNMNKIISNTSVTSLDITQPSGDILQVTLCRSKTSNFGKSAFQPETAWVSGIVRLVADGTAYCGQKVACGCSR